MLDIIVLQLLAPCQFKVTQAIFRLGDEDFTWSGTQPVSAGFTAAMPWLSVSSHTTQVELVKGQTWDVKQVLQNCRVLSGIHLYLITVENL